MDDVFWKRTGNGEFSVKPAYGKCIQNVHSDGDRIWKKMWKWRGPQKICIFLWFSVQDKLLTNVQRVKRGMACMDSCHRYAGW